MVSVTHQLLNSINIFLELLAIIVTAAIAFYGYKIYHFTKKINYLHFCLSFSVLSLASAAKIVTNLLYFPAVADTLLRILTFGSPTFEQLVPIYSLGTLAYRLLTLLGLLGIFWIIGKYHEKNKLFMLVYFAFVIALISIIPSGVMPLYFFFHSTAALFLAYISYFYFRAHGNNKRKDTKYIAFSFLFLCISQLLIAASQIIFGNVIDALSIAYIIEEGLQLIGYSILLWQYYILIKRK